MPETHCVMLGLGGPTFITDWAKAVSRFATVTGLTVVTKIPPGTKRIARGVAVANISGFETVFIRRRRMRPVRYYWKWNARRQAVAMERGLRLMGWDPSILHAHFFAGAAAVPELATRLGIPFVITEHTSRLAAKNAERYVSRQGIDIMKDVFAHAAGVFFVGEEQLRSANRLGATGTFDVIPNPVDTSLFSAKAVPSRTFRIVTIGHLNKRKRQDLLIEALADVTKEYPTASVDIIGGGEQSRTLKRMVRDLGLQRSVTLHGWTQREEIAKILQDASLYVHTSKRESFGVAIVEALLSGTPVVALRCGGVTEELHESVGVTVDTTEASTLAASIVDALRRLESGTFATPGEIGTWASERYGSEAVAAAVQKHYDRILEPR